jgi:hypothetical protein
VLRWYLWTVTDLHHHSPHNSTLISTGQILLPATHLVSVPLPLMQTLTTPSLHKSFSLSDDEYNFDVIPPVRISPALLFAWFCGLRVFSKDSHAQPAQHPEPHHHPARDAERGGCTQSANTGHRSSTSAITSCSGGFRASSGFRSLQFLPHAVSHIWFTFVRDIRCS